MGSGHAASISLSLSLSLSLFLSLSLWVCLGSVLLALTTLRAYSLFWGDGQRLNTKYKHFCNLFFHFCLDDDGELDLDVDARTLTLTDWAECFFALLCFLRCKRPLSLLELLKKNPRSLSLSLSLTVPLVVCQYILNKKIGRLCPQNK